MLKKTITYTDYNDEEVTEDFYFNISKLDLAEHDLELDLRRTIEQLNTTTENKEAYGLFKFIILSAYGVRGEDGKKFYKKDRVTGIPHSRDLEASPALEALIFEFLENPEKGAQFMEACLPANLVAEAKAAEGSSTVELPASDPVLSGEDLEPTDEELLQMHPKDMTEAQLRRAFALKSGS